MEALFTSIKNIGEFAVKAALIVFVLVFAGWVIGKIFDSKWFIATTMITVCLGPGVVILYYAIDYNSVDGCTAGIVVLAFGVLCLKLGWNDWVKP